MIRNIVGSPSRVTDFFNREELIELLREGDYELIPVGPYQQPAQYVQAFKEGTSIGRSI